MKTKTATYQGVTPAQWYGLGLGFAMLAGAVYALPMMASAQVQQQQPATTTQQQTQQQQQFQLNRQLDLGATGEDVRQVQQFLAQDPDLYPSGLVTGFFGPLTQMAVQRYQCARDIVCTGAPQTTGFGRVGPQTMEVMNAELRGETDVGGAALIEQQLDPGDSGQNVTNLQRFLADDPELYSEGLITGYYGPLTQQAVERFQCQNEIVCQGTPETTGYGRVGPATMAQVNQEIEQVTGIPGTGTGTGTTTPTQQQPSTPTPQQQIQQQQPATQTQPATRTPATRTPATTTDDEPATTTDEEDDILPSIQT